MAQVDELVARVPESARPGPPGRDGPSTRACPPRRAAHGRRRGGRPPGPRSRRRWRRRSRPPGTPGVARRARASGGGSPAPPGRRPRPGPGRCGGSRRCRRRCCRRGCVRGPCRPGWAPGRPRDTGEGRQTPGRWSRAVPAVLCVEDLRHCRRAGRDGALEVHPSPGRSHVPLRDRPRRPRSCSCWWSWRWRSRSSSSTRSAWCSGSAGSQAPREPGLRLIVPFVDVMHRVSKRIVTMPIQSQGIITRDNVSVDVSAVAYFRVVDAVRSVVAIENVRRSDRPDRPDDAAQGRRPAHPGRDAVGDGPHQPRHPRDPRRHDRRVGCRGDPGGAQGHPAPRQR